MEKGVAHTYYAERLAPAAHTLLHAGLGAMQEARRQSRWPYTRYRPGQKEAAARLAATVREGGVFALSAPTGFGKTATIIHGLLQAGAGRVLYLVRTRNEIVPVIRELRRFGVTSYVFLYSARRMCPLNPDADVSLEDFWENCRVLRLSGRCSHYSSLARLDTGLLRELLVRNETPYQVVAAVSAAGFCPFFALRTLIGESLFVVATYPYLFSRDIFRSTFEPLDYSDFTIVIDEAHALLNIASLLEARLTLRDLEAAAREAEEYGLPTDIAEAADKLKKLLAKHLETATLHGLRRAPLSEIRRILGDPQVWEDAAAEVRVAKLREALESAEVHKVRVALGRLAVFAHEAHQEGRGAYFFTDGRRRGVTVLPLEPCPVTREPLSLAKAVVLASGTLPPPRLLRQVLCIENKHISYYDVEIIHGNIYGGDTRRVIIAAEPTSRYTYRTPAMYMLYAQYLLATYHATRKAVLAVYPSYDFMRSVVASLQGLAGRNTLQLVTEEPTTQIDTVVDRLAETPHTIVNAVAGGKLVEGVEYRVKGENLLGTVFVAGLPFPQPDDYLRDRLKAAALRASDHSLEYELYEAEAVIRVKQAIGRAQRDPTRDHALVVLADTRYLRESIKRKLRIRYDSIAYSLREYEDIIHRVAKELRV